MITKTQLFDPRSAWRLNPGLLLHAQALWEVMGRPEQHPPSTPWDIWLLLGGRGSGKTRAGAEWIRDQVWEHGKRHIALIAPDYDEGRNVMLEGQSGLLNIGYVDERPKFYPSLHKLEWPNGATGRVFSSADPDGLRGPQFDCAWADEFCAWKNAEDTLSNLRLALRLGDAPQLVVTTTPKPNRALAALMDMPGIIVSRTKTHDNAAHLAPNYIPMMEATYGGTRKGRQEIYGEIIDDPTAGLWNRDMFKRGCVNAYCEIVKTIVAVDPPGSRTAKGDACGVIVASLAVEKPGGRFVQGHPRRVYVRRDATVRGLSTGTWAEHVITTAQVWNADYIVAETNIGGDMVVDVLRQHDKTMHVRKVTATKSKRTRAEPVAALYEQGRVIHADDRLEQLEDELIRLGSYEGYIKGKHQSPDRADALVWAVWDLLVEERGEGPRITVM